MDPQRLHTLVSWAIQEKTPAAICLTLFILVGYIANQLVPVLTLTPIPPGTATHTTTPKGIS